MTRTGSAFALAVLVAAPAVLAPAAAARPAPQALVFGDVTIADGLGTAPRKGSVAIVDGRLVLGTGPSGARRVAVDGAWLAPGFVEPSGRAGYVHADAEGTREMTPDVDARDLADVRSSAFREAAFEGCTTVVLAPGATNVVGGLTQAFHAWTPEGAAVPIAGAPQALQIALADEPTNGNFPPRSGPTTSIYARRPTTRMGVVWMLRQTFLAAKGVQQPPDGADLARYRDVLEGRRTLRVVSHAVQDLNAGVRLADEAGFRYVLEGADEGYMVREALGRRATQVISGPLPSVTSGVGPEFTDTALRNTAILREAGCTVALTAGAQGGRWLREQAMFAARYGLTRDEALAAATSVAADICGLPDRGRIAEGAAADVVLWSGHPLLPSSRMLMVVVDGRVVFDRTGEE